MTHTFTVDNIAMEKKLRRSPRFVNLPGGVRFVTAKQPGVPGLGLKYIGKDVLKAVVGKETLCTPKRYRRLMEWRGTVSGSEEEILDHLVNKGDVVRLAEDTILLPERCGPQLAAWGTGAGRNCKLKASKRGAYLEQMKDLQPDQFLCLGYGANFTAKNTGWEPAQISPPRVTREPRRQGRPCKQKRDSHGRFTK